MVSLASAGNVAGTCLRVLRARGYSLQLDVGLYEDDDGLLRYRAERDGFSFAASTPLELLGLTAVYEHVLPSNDEPYWWAVDGPDIDDELMGEALERALDDLRQRNPARWVQEVRRACVQAADEPSVGAADRLGISEAAFTRIMVDPLLDPPPDDATG